MARSTASVWGRDVLIDRNSVRQLLVRAHEDVRIEGGADGILRVCSPLRCLRDSCHGTSARAVSVNW